MGIKLTTDEWTEKNFPKLAVEIESIVKSLTGSNESKTYSVRRYIMMCLRHGNANEELLKYSEKRE